jgi:hypothetical protein
MLSEYVNVLKNEIVKQRLSIRLILLETTTTTITYDTITKKQKFKPLKNDTINKHKTMIQ